MKDDNYILIKAIHGIVKDTPEYNIRFLQRWYSEKFSTPLPYVEENVDLEDIMLHFYEVKYEDMEEERLKHEAQEILMTPEEKAAKSKEDDNFLENIVSHYKNLNETVSKLAEKLKNLPDQAQPLTKIEESKQITPINMDFSEKSETPPKIELFGPKK